MTATDQPTTGPSVQAVAEALHRHESGSSRWDGCLPCTKRAQVLADAGLLAPAPQPADDTETEVQWGVRGMVAGQTVIEGPMSKFQAEGHLGERGASTFRTSAVVSRTATYTPWEDAT